MQMLYHNQKQLDTDTEKFFCLLKLHAHFKDHNKTQTSNQLYQAFKVETRTNGHIKKRITPLKLSYI